MRGEGSPLKTKATAYPHHDSSTIMCSCVYRSRDKLNYKQRSPQIQVGSSSLNNECSHREAVDVGLAYIRINKTPVYELFLGLEKAQRSVSKCAGRIIIEGMGVGTHSPFFTQTIPYPIFSSFVKEYLDSRLVWVNKVAKENGVNSD